MKLENHLKNLKHIEPDKDYKEKSRLLILRTTPAARSAKIFDAILKNIELAAALGLAGVLIFLVFGGFSAWKNLEPLNLSGLDPVGLRAEANAIDIQIKLANLAYDASGTLPQAETPPAAAPRAASVAAPKSAAASGTEADNATSSPYMSVDEVLDALSK